MNENLRDLKITISFDKQKFKKTLFKLADEKDCSTCEYEEQKQWKDTQMPVCNMCDHDFWWVKEELFDKLISECINIMK